VVLLASISYTHRHLSGIHFLVAQNKHIGHFLLLCITNLSVHTFRALVQLDAYSFGAKFLRHLVCILKMTIRNGDNNCLYGSHPDRKCTAKMLDQHTKEALHTAEQSAVHHVRLMRLPVQTVRGG
jgi:hypothetical protein